MVNAWEFQQDTSKMFEIQLPPKSSSKSSVGKLMQDSTEYLSIKNPQGYKT